MTILVGLGLLMGVSVGCSDDDEGVTDGRSGSTAIKVDEIIFNPKSPAPGDTMRATAVVSSSSPNVGDFVKYSWSATGGTFLETTKSSVRWVAPNTSSVYSFTCSASNSVSTSKLTEDVFVGGLDDFITERAGELHTLPGGGALYYLSPPADLDSGLVVRFKDLSSDALVFPADPPGEQYSFDRDVTQAAHMYVEEGPVTRLTVVHDDLQSAIQTVIAREDRPFPLRANEFSSPYVSYDGQLITYQGSLLDQEAPPQAGGVDTFTIYVYEIASQQTQKAVFEGDVYGNFYPSFSSDNQQLVFVSNRGGTIDWEYYALPMSGSTVTPDTAQGALVQISSSGGLMGGESLPPGDRPRAWNPNPAFPIMAVIATNERLFLVPADGSGDAVVDIDGKVVDFSWSSSGQTLAAASFDGDVNRSSIHLVGMAGDAALLLQAGEGDRIGGLAWSGDDEFLIYTVQRSGEVWYEIADVGGSSNLTKPARITPAWLPSAEGAAAFGPPLMSLRSAWLPGSMTALLFLLDEDTPRVVSIDLSGIAP